MWFVILIFMGSLGNCKMKKSITKTIAMILAPLDVLARGILHLGPFRVRKQDAQFQLFHEHYGSSHIVLANIWNDLTTTLIDDARLDDKDKSESGFKMFLIASFFLYTYPKNRGLMASRFLMCTKYCGGERLWKWVTKIGALKVEKIRWDDLLDDPESETFIITVDGTDFRTWEPKHPTYNQDKKQCSQKHNHAAKKFEIGLSVYRAQCVWISGPHRGGKHDMEIFREGLKHMIAPGKRVIADRGYQTNREDEKMLSLPSHLDSKELYRFKSRARLRHETFNGRVHAFKSMSDTFRHGEKKLRQVFEAVTVTVQYQMDNGAEIFSV
jgi:hypothetical protein